MKYRSTALERCPSMSLCWFGRDRCTSMRSFSASSSPQDDVKPKTKASDSLIVWTYFAIVFCAVLLTVIVVLGITKKDAATIRTPDFCCADEALALVERHNTSLDPCSDFHAYACMRAVDVNSTYLSRLFRIHLHQVNLELRADSLDSPSGRAFVALRRSCAKQNWNAEVTLVNFTSAIMKAAGVSARMDPADVARFLVLVEFRYKLPGLVTFRDKENSARTSLVVRRGHWIPSTLNISCFRCISSMIAAFNTLLNVDVSASEVMSFNEKMPAENTDYSTTNRSVSESPFASVASDAWRNILKDLVYPVLPGVKYIIQETGSHVDTLIAHIGTPANQPLAVALLVINTVLGVYQEFVDSNALSWVRPRADCSSLVLRVNELLESFEAQVVATPERDDHVRDIFRRIRQAVATDASSSSTFGKEGSQRINDALNSMQLLLPGNVTIADAPPPNIVPSDFPSGLLAARSFGFEVQRTKVQRKINDLDPQSYVPDVSRRGNVLCIPSSVYLTLNFESTHRLSLNLPVVGVQLARELWSFLFERSSWADETTKNIERYRLCFESSHFSWTTNSTARRRRAQMIAAAVATTVGVVEKSDWLEMKRVSASVRMSRGRLFYLALADSLCGDVFRPSAQEDVDTFARNTPDFSAVFGCAAVNGSRSSCRV
ncbi:hypothetical protein IscW_ISCW011243 [Ixodes scapularis]|uniref:Peptidase M13 N-terminal domain-containing protein n=1 Tax=Ixodes scapularis TaxID=6945 RepID=B7Q4E5_IXOSC|nr:hypothetical protein IscW_ISCW011243 [Ixodes scapularis]|eukprot:XP_002411525.1 hypothetical protein IscW_ISCW011243 [Ixodes scapularis]